MYNYKLYIKTNAQVLWNVVYHRELERKAKEDEKKVQQKEEEDGAAEEKKDDETEKEPQQEEKPAEPEKKKPTVRQAKSKLERTANVSSGW